MIEILYSFCRVGITILFCAEFRWNCWLTLRVFCCVSENKVELDRTLLSVVGVHVAVTPHSPRKSYMV